LKRERQGGEAEVEKERLRQAEEKVKERFKKEQRGKLAGRLQKERAARERGEQEWTKRRGRAAAPSRRQRKTQKMQSLIPAGQVFAESVSGRGCGDEGNRGRERDEGIRRKNMYRVLRSTMLLKRASSAV
jgi:hypothetical protein